MVPTVTANQTGSNSVSSYAFLPSWSGSIPGDLDNSGESFGNHFTNHDFDDQGNMYYLISEDYANPLGISVSGSVHNFIYLCVSMNMCKLTCVSVRL